MIISLWLCNYVELRNYRHLMLRSSFQQRPRHDVAAWGIGRVYPIFGGTIMGFSGNTQWEYHCTYTGWWLTYPSEKWWTSSVGMMTFPTEWKIKVMFQTTNQYKITNNWTIWVSENRLLYSPNDHLQYNDDTHPFHLRYHTFRQSQVVNHLTTNSKGKSSPILAKLTCMGAVETWHSQMHSYLCVEQDNAGWWFQPLWKIWKSVGVTIPNIWKVIKTMFQTSNQNGLGWHWKELHCCHERATSMNRPTTVQPKNR